MTVISHRGSKNALVKNAIALMTATVGSAGLGLAFWVVTAHLFDPATVGRASAQVAAVTLVAGLGQLSIVSIFARFLPVARARTVRMIKAGYATTLAASFLIAVGFVLFGFGRDFLDHGVPSTVLFVVCVLVFAIFSLQDVVLTAFRHATWVLWENIGVAAIRLAALPLLFFFGRSLGAFGAWAIPMMGAVAVVSWLIFRHLGPARVRQGDDRGLLPNRSELLNYTASQYVNSVITSIGGLLPPVLVVSFLGARAGAAFYLPWLFCTATTALLWNIQFSLVVEAVHATDRTRHLLKRAAWLGALVTCDGGAVIGFGAPWILGIAGASYRAEGTVVLRLLALSLPFIGVYSLYSALALITKRTWLATALDGVGAVIFLVGSVATASRHGLVAFGTAFLVSRIVIAVASVPGIVIEYRRLAKPDEMMLESLDRDLAARAAETQLLYPIFAVRGIASVPTGSSYVADGLEWAGMADAYTSLLPRDDRGTVVLSVVDRSDRSGGADGAELVAARPSGPVDDRQAVAEAGASAAGVGIAGVGVVGVGAAGGVGAAAPNSVPATPNHADPLRTPAADERVGGPPAPGGGRPSVANGTSEAGSELVAPRYPSGEMKVSRVGRLLARGQLRGANAVLAWTAVALSAATPVIIALPISPLAKVLVVLAFACFAPGAAALCHVRLGSAVVSWAIALVVSMAIVALPGAVMLWARYWHPFLALYLLVGMSAAAAIVGLAPTVAAHTRIGRRVIADIERAGLASSASAAGTMTTLLPAASSGEADGDLVATRVLPRLANDGLRSAEPADGNGTGAARPAQPRPVGSGGDPRTNADSADATQVISAVPDGVAADQSNPARDAAATGVTGSGSRARWSIRRPRAATQTVAASHATTGAPVTSRVTTTPDGTVPTTDVDGAPSESAGDATRVIPAVRDANETVVIRLPPFAETAWPPASGVTRADGIPADRVARASDGAADNITEAGTSEGAQRTDTEADQAARTTRAMTMMIVEVAILAAAVGCWIVSLRLSSTKDVGDYGLLSVMHPTFFVALGLCVAGFLVTLTRDVRRVWLLVGYIAVLLAIMHATVPVLVHEPEYAWTYKHIGVIQLFRVTGHIVNSSDIYQAWPAFFAAVAQLGTWSHVSTTTLAAWAPLFFDAANCLPLFATVQSLTSDRRLPYLTVFVFTSVNWIGQDYLSPQAFAYVLCLGTILIMVRWLRRQRGQYHHRFRLVDRLWSRLHEGLEAVPYVGKRSERAALACLYFVFAIVVIAHQLSPYLIAASATALLLLGLLRTWQVVPILIGITATYLLPHYNVVDQYGIFDGLNIFQNLLSGFRGTAPLTANSSAGEIFSAQAVHLLSLLVWGGALIAIMVSRRRLGAVALPAVLAFAPLATLVAQTYGGEAIYRVFLFSAPWCVYLICRMALRIRKVWVTAGVAAATALVFVGALIGIQGEHGQLTFDQFTRGEVQAVQYLYNTAPAGSHIVEAADNLPARLNQRYVDLNFGGDPDLLQPLLPTNHATITEADLAKINDYCSGLDTGVYVIISRSQVAYAHYFGYLPDGLLPSLQRAMDSSPAWTVLYRNADAVIYQFRG
ncbi:MAG TPA: oligosaccharide flippase family protein [Micromonosporaceae bacterium]|nr:oligosaccharide flippase family protein [Micromonosporaceae bacterium]